MSALLDRIEAHVRNRPEALAVLDGPRGVTYEALWRAAGGVAARIASQPFLRHEAVVVVDAPRSLEWIVQTLGAWMAGAAPLFVDPAGPTARKVALLQRARAHRLDLSGPPAAPEPSRFPGPRRLAYVIGTSGSTGAPKLIEVEHCGLGGVLADQVQAFDIGPGDRVYWMLGPAFDASLSDVGTALWAGATVLVSRATPDGVFEDMARLDATHVDLPPALMAALDPSRAPDCLRTVVFGGEPSPPERLRRWARRLRLVQAYGPTEATICTHLAVVDPKTWCAPELGRPIAGMRHHVVDEELWLAGPGLMRGYRGDPELTADRFVEQDGLRWYRTGDRVAREGDRLVFLGRLDRQLKVAGRLVAPEEVEAALCAHPSVHRAAVRQEGLHLVAHVEGDEDADLPEFLKARLPDYLRPARIEWGALPSVGSGKIDRAALERGEPSIAAWQRRFEFALRRPVGPDEPLFDAGGDSLAVLELVAAAEAEGLHLDVEVLHAHPTPRALARAFATQTADSMPPGARRIDDLDALATQLTPELRPGARRPTKPARLLLTGATGFLGVHVLAALRGRAEAVALVRDVARAEAAFAEARARYELRFETPAMVVGDVRKSGFDLEDPTEALACEGLIHCAGALSLTATFDALLDVNARGLANAIAFVQPRPIVCAGSLVIFVAGNGAGALHLESEGPDGTWLLGAYAQSKYVADVIARAPGGPPIANVRLGLLVGSRRQARGAPDDWLGRAVRAWGEALPDLPEDVAFDAVPVDHAAEVMARLALDPPAISETFHVAGPEPITLARLRKALAARPLRAAPDPAAQLARSRGGDPRNRSPFDLFLATGQRFDTRHTEARTGLVAPRLDDEDVLRYVEAMGEAR